jgi:hypothetical protein
LTRARCVLMIKLCSYVHTLKGTAAAVLVKRFFASRC